MRKLKCCTFLSFVKVHASLDSRLPRPAATFGMALAPSASHGFPAASVVPFQVTKYRPLSKRRERERLGAPFLHFRLTPSRYDDSVNLMQAIGGLPCIRRGQPVCYSDAESVVLLALYPQGFPLPLWGIGTQPP